MNCLRSEYVNRSLLLFTDSEDCVERAYEGEDFPEHTPLAVGAYPEPEQWKSGDKGPLSELYPTGEYDEPERSLDAIFWPPMLWVARNQDASTCKVLLEIGADPNYISPAGMTVVLATLRGANTYESPQDAVAVINVVATDGQLYFPEGHRTPRRIPTE